MGQAPIRKVCEFKDTFRIPYNHRNAKDNGDVSYFSEIYGGTPFCRSARKLSYGLMMLGMIDLIAESHKMGIFIPDFKAQNVMIRKTGEVTQVDLE